MELQRQWCANECCPDFGKIEAGNIQVFSYVESRYYCTTCSHTFSADQGTFFETLRSARSVVIDAVALLNERNSLRAIERLKHHSPNRLLHWLDLAGQHAAAVSADCIQDLHLTQVQIDELWTFVKKNKNTFARTIRRMLAICGSGVRWHCPVGYVWSVI
jgi:transposase-like protein